MSRENARKSFTEKVSRRDFLRTSTNAFAGTFIAACSSSSVPLFAQANTHLDTSEKTRRALIVMNSATPKGEVAQIFSSSYGYNRARVAAVVGAYNISKSNLTPAKKKEALVNLRENVLKDNSGSYDAKFRNGVYDILQAGDDREDAAWAEGRKYLTDGFAVGAVVTSANPPLAIALGLTSILGTYVPDKTTLFGSTLNPDIASRDLADFAVNHACELYNSNKEFRNVMNDPFFQNEMGMNFKDDLNQCINKAPEAVANVVKKTLGKQLTSDEQKQIAEQFVGEVAGQFDNFRESLVNEILSRQKKAEQDEINARINKEKVKNEISSGAYLLGYLGKELFNDERIPVVIDTLYQSYEKISTALENFDKGISGILTTAATFTSVTSLVSGLLTGSLFGPDPTTKALQQIQQSIDNLRNEMHERFDEVVENQKKTLLVLNEILTTLKTNTAELHRQVKDLDRKINSLDDYLRHEARKGAEDRLEKSILRLKTEQDDLKNKPRDYEKGAVQEALVDILSYAKHISTSPSHSMTEIGTTWDVGKVSDNFKKMEYIDLAVGTVMPIYHLATNIELEKDLIANPTILGRAAILLATNAAEHRSALNSTIISEFRKVRERATKLNATWTKILQPEVINSLRKIYEEKYDQLIDIAIESALKTIPTHSSDELPKDTPTASVYPFNLPFISDDAQLHYQREAVFPLGIVLFDNNYKEKENLLTSRTTKPLAGRIVFNEISSHVSADLDVMRLAQQYNIISIKLSDSKRYTKAMEGMIIPIGVINRKGIMEVEYFDMLNLKTIYKNPSAANAKGARQRLNNVVLKLAKYYNTDTQYNAWDITFLEGRLKGNNEINLAETVTSEHSVAQLTHGKHSFELAPATINGLKLSRTTNLLQTILEDIIKHHEVLRDGFKTEFQNTILNKNPELMREFETIGASITYLAGLCAWLDGDSLANSTWLAKDKASLWASKDELAAQFKDILDIMKAKDKDGNPIKSTPETIQSYTKRVMKERFTANLDMYLSAQFPKKTHNNQFFPTTLAIRCLDDFEEQHARVSGRGR